ncbi:MAG TPA: hypothetical protein VGX28_12050 [Frankiaceae bacterium]|jgi:hypothetical protein|nr:hypothetical protein [Frankiaceae bacterium]
MSRVARRLASTAVAVAAVGILATPALAAPCASGERITGRTDVGYICTNIKTGAERIVPFGR